MTRTSCGSRRWRRRGMVRHEDLRQDQRRDQSAGVDRLRRRYEWQREARRIRRTRSAARSHKDKRVNAPFYGVAPSPIDDSIWGSVTGMPGLIVRLTLGSNPPSTALTEIYEVPFKDSKAPSSGICAARDGRGQQRRRGRCSSDILPASIGASARDRSMARTPGQAVSGRLVAVSAAGSQLQGSD